MLFFFLGGAQGRVPKFLLTPARGCGPIPLRSLFAWHETMESVDLLHTVWIGVARDAIGSFLMDLAEHSPCTQDLASWDERLLWVSNDARSWLKRRKLASSLVDEWCSLTSFTHTVFGMARCGVPPVLRLDKARS